MTGLAREATAALRWQLTGCVQGVGFRPFVFRLASEYGLSGWVRNAGGELEVHAEGPGSQLRRFGAALVARAPVAASPRLVAVTPAARERLAGFRILASVAGDQTERHLPVDLAICADCIAELYDPLAARHRYPLVNCTQCGPRYTVILALPYDRPNTTLAGFTLCATCAGEYGDPLDRRFHAQPLACACCGPTLTWTEDGHTSSGDAAAIASAVQALQAGRTIAVRGVGGYHLLCDALNEAAVGRLRQRKQRPTKPLAVMVPRGGVDGLAHARRYGRLSAAAAAALGSAAHPIVIVPLSSRAGLSDAIAPGLGEVGLMLPYSPLHELLLHDFGSPVVATSGNRRGEPVLTDPAAAQLALDGVADSFLHHNRPIARAAEDPVLREIAGRVRPVRLGRGTAPLELELAVAMPTPTLAVGAYGKLTVALAWGHRAIVSPHLGDLATPAGRSAWTTVVADLQALYGVRARCIAHDAHPGYPTARWARSQGLATAAVWHHHAHASALAGEFSDDAPLLCFTWDGVGLGTDGTLWGGEALLGRPGHWQRVASLRRFRLPGGERAARQPWRSALALCWTASVQWPDGARWATPLLQRAFDRGLNAPLTSSAGRLFDGAAALLGCVTESGYEGEAGMHLEALCTATASPVAMPLVVDERGLLTSDWSTLLPALLDPHASTATRAALFHSSLAAAACAQAVAVRRVSGIARVGLTGGVFQNRVLCEELSARLATEGFDVVLPARLPMNDAAISFGQLVESAARSSRPD